MLSSYPILLQKCRGLLTGTGAYGKMGLDCHSVPSYSNVPGNEFSRAVFSVSNSHFCPFQNIVSGNGFRHVPFRSRILTGIPCPHSTTGKVAGSFGINTPENTRIILLYFVLRFRAVLRLED